MEVPLLWLISFDGFWSGYLNYTYLPNFISLAQKGARVRNVRPNYATMTLPNHWGILTGLYEESSGIVGNHMWDEKIGEKFLFGKDDVKMREKYFATAGDPIWYLNQQNEGRSCQVMFPSGCLRVRGVDPTFCLGFNHSMPFSERLDIAFREVAAKDCNLVLMYFEEPDGSGHRLGSGKTKEMVDMLFQVDQYLGLLIHRLSSRENAKFNLMVVSDHGMLTVQAIEFDEFKKIRMENIDHFAYNHVHVGVWPEPGKKEEVYADLKDLPHTKLQRKDEIPDVFHYSHNGRVAPLFLIADQGFYFHWPNISYNGSMKGEHGFDNRRAEMQAIFFGMGCDFVPGAVVEEMEIVDNFAIACHLLHIPCQLNNASFDRVASLFNNQSNWLRKTKTALEEYKTGAALAIIGGLCLVLACIFACVKCGRNAYPRKSREHTLLRQFEDEDDTDHFIVES